MARLLIHVEGQTEESFVNQVLRDHLVDRGYDTVVARIVGNARLRRQRGGIRPWSSVRRDIISHLRQDSNAISTTMVDYYGLPQKGDEAWPGRAQAIGHKTMRKAASVEDALLRDLASAMRSSFNSARFVPFVVMHEFEGLLFSDCTAFSRGIGHPELETRLRAIREQFETPEDINDSPDTAPSKRVEALMPGYQKPTLGVRAVREIGLAGIRGKCPHFDAWLKQLESLVA
jgi:hypothetical protein